MNHRAFCYIAAAALCAAGSMAPGHAQTWRQGDLSVNFEGNADHCSDLRARSTRELAQSAETFTLRKAEAPVLEVDAPSSGGIRVRAWGQPNYSVEVCKIAVADSRIAADQLLKSISVARSAGRFASTRSGGDEGRWQVFFIVHAPRNASLDLQTKNGPIDVDGVSGTLKARATNGPVSLHECSGAIQVSTANGPISLAGGGGDVHLNAQNGPISLELAGNSWSGVRLVAGTVNGPVSIAIPDRFRSGVRVETSGHAPVSCHGAACGNAFTGAGGDRRVLQLNGSGDSVRVSTENGPVSITAPGKARRII